MIKTKCPNCGGKLEIARLTCPDCKAEYPISYALSPFELLDDAQFGFLETFLKCKGNLKSLCEMLDISYPTAKKRFDELLISLGYLEQEKKYEEDFSMTTLNQNDISGNDAAQIVKRKLYECGGSADITLFDGSPCHIALTKDGNSFVSDKIMSYKLPYNFSVFDCIVDLLMRSPGHQARKGNARNYKVGYGDCTEDTVAGTIAIQYFGKKTGESAFDPTFVMAAVLEWAGIAQNLRGYIRLI